MALPEFPSDSAGTITGTSSEDMFNGGHRTRFFPLLGAVLGLAGYVRDAASALLELADQVAEDAASAAAGSGTEASVAAIRAGAAAEYISIRRILAANTPVSLTRASTTNWDMSTGINFNLLLNGNVTILASPTGMVAGKSGVLRIAQDSTGGRTIGAYGSDLKWVGGVPRLPSEPNAVAFASYLVWDDGKVYLTYGGAAS